MGNTRSIISSEDPDYWWPNVSSNSNQQIMEEAHTNSENTNIEQKPHDEFDVKREKRKEILAAKKVEVHMLRSNLERYIKENEELRFQISKIDSFKQNVTCDKCELHKISLNALITENEGLKSAHHSFQKELAEMNEMKMKNRELNISISAIRTELQRMNTELLSIETERQEYQNHIKALKDVIKLTKQMVQIREDQVKELNAKIKTIEEILASKEMKLMSDDLRKEYERQLRNIRNLRTLYEVRQTADRREREQLEATLADQKLLYETEKTKVGILESTIEEQQQNISNKYDQIASLESNLGLSNAECRDLKSEINAINQVFSQILLSFNNSQNLDFDKLIKDLQDNHDLLAKIIVNEQSPEISASQTKVLLDLINQSDDCANCVDSKEYLVQNEEKINNSLRKSTILQTIPEEAEPSTSSQHLNSPEQIVENLPKVWKVLIELLSQQNPPCNITEGNSSTETSCYKSVQTPTGPKLVLSVSQTFIRLKDLILEKKSLEKEMGRLKNLNGHLEERLQEQEKRLHLVSGELSKTWNVVGKMQKQHEQLHTQERILRYELAHKRKMLMELKQELEYCREKWVQAREKNTETEIQWKQLRSEFTSRKVRSDNYSAESGYSDDKSSSDDDVDIQSEKDDDANVDIDNSEDQQNRKSNSPNTMLISLCNTETIATPTNEIVTLEKYNDENETASKVVEIQLVENSNANSQIELDTKVSNENSVTVKKDKSTDVICNTSVEISEEATAGPSNQKPSLEDMFSRREERLQRLEEQCKSLVSKVNKTTVKSNEISDKLDNLHEIYGESSESATTLDMRETNSGTQDSTNHPPDKTL